MSAGRDPIEPTARFGSRASAYAAFRPEYPAGAIGAVLAGLGDPQTLTLADAGAGTGISARLFADRGVRVVAIEPNASMREAAQPHPLVTWRDGTAERTGLADGSVDVIVACQAFHWFDAAAALEEFARVARRRAAMLQYERDERDAFTRAYGDVVRAYATDDTEALRARAIERFAAVPNAFLTRTAYVASQVLDRSGLLGRAASASYLPATGPASDALRRDLETIFERYERGGVVELATVTYALVADWLR